MAFEVVLLVAKDESSSNDDASGEDDKATAIEAFDESLMRGFFLGGEEFITFFSPLGVAGE